MRRTRGWARAAAVVAVAALVSLGQSVAGVSASAPPQASPFVFRGVVDGKYGPTTTHAERADLVRWMGSQGLNVYVHAYKDDLFQRYWWREPYPDSQMREFAEEIAIGAAAGVEWVPNIQPGTPLLSDTPIDTTPPSRDVCYSCADDLATIFAKFDRFFDAGSRTFMVSFDDVQKVSTHPEDMAAYGSGDRAFGQMNRDLLNAVHRRYSARAGGGSFTLLTVLVDYTGTSDTEYLSGVRDGGGLDEGIEVFWTGGDVVSATVGPEGAAAYAALVGRSKVLLWDNYPVNDFTGGGVGVDPRDKAQWGPDTRLFMGPYAGRSPALPSAVAGVLANPMHQLRASRVALGTMAAYLSDPIGYEPEAAWRAEILELAGGDAVAADALAAFAENSRSSGLDPAESVAFAAKSGALLAALDEGAHWPQPSAALLAELTREGTAKSVLETTQPALAGDIGPFLSSLAANSAVSATATNLLASQRPSLRASSSTVAPGVARISGRAASPSAFAVTRLLAQLDSEFALRLTDPHFVHGTRAGTDLARVFVNENRVDAFVGEAKVRTYRWLATAGASFTSVTVTVAGAPVALDASGGFSVDVPTGASIEVIATDGAGGKTGLIL